MRLRTKNEPPRGPISALKGAVIMESSLFYVDVISFLHIMPKNTWIVEIYVVFLYSSCHSRFGYHVTHGM